MMQVNIREAVCDNTPVLNRIGIAKGKLASPSDLDRDNQEIAERFGCLIRSKEKSM